MENSEKSSILKTTREAKGLTLEIVHEATKIPLDALKAIEEGYSSRILSPFYFRGFLKIYAEFLGLDVKEIYQQYGIDQPVKPVASAQPQNFAKSRHKEPVQPNVFVEQLQEMLALVFKPRNLKVVGQILGVLVAVFLIIKVFGWIGAHWPHHRAASVHHVVVSPEEKKVAVYQPPARPVVNTQSEDDKVEVAVRASKDTWLRVKTDDQVVFESTLSKGSLETWTANDHIELSGRNIELLDMEVNNKHVGFLGGGERRIRRVMITKEGLTVKK